MSILSKIFSSDSSIDIGPYQKKAEQVNTLEERYANTALEKFPEETNQLKERIAKGETLDDLLPEAFAVVREVSKRVLSQRHFDVQLVGGAVLHEGKIAEMKTGEGKTLTSTLPVYLNALAGKGVHVITVNDYLARRDAIWMGQIYHRLGLQIGCITHEASYIYDPSYQSQGETGTDLDKQRDALGGFKVFEEFLRPATRKEAYAADITYGTNNEFGFDYLRDNMAARLEDQVQRGHIFAVVDEIDSVLIDEARTPLIISAPDQESSNWYLDFARLMPQLNAETDYAVDEKMRAVTLTEEGINHVEQLLGVQDIYQEKGIKYLHHLEQALKAQVLFKKDKDYVVRQGQVVIVDEFTGRMLAGRRYSGGLHQALEAKEGVQVQPESLTLASITFQNYFRMYEKLSGMTGTAKTSQEEFYKVYGLEVVEVPTNKPMVRKDLSDRIYKTEEAKFKAVAQQVKECHERKQPVLVGTVSIQKNEYIGKLLQMEGIPHEILNAKNHEREAEIIAQAGRLGAVTVATNMAGRGVDIILGGNPPDEEEAAKVREVGGLFVIGTERHEARRIDNQLRGRAGRQGDPGSSQFFVSLEDDIARIFGGDRIRGIMEKFRFPEDQPIESRIVSNSIESAQSRIEGFNFDARKHVLQYDDVLNRHRGAVYKKRRTVLEKAEIQDPSDEKSLAFHMKGLLKEHGYTKEDYEKKEAEVGAESMRQLEKLVSLRVIDNMWVEHLENMEALRDSVRLRAYGQQDPLVEYKNEGHRMFQSLIADMDKMIADTLLKAQVNIASHNHNHNHTNTHTSAPVYNRSSQSTSARPAPAQPKIGRNDPCFCGSGKKYKKCHGA